MVMPVEGWQTDVKPEMQSILAAGQLGNSQLNVALLVSVLHPPRHSECALKNHVSHFERGSFR